MNSSILQRKWDYSSLPAPGSSFREEGPDGGWREQSLFTIGFVLSLVLLGYAACRMVSWPEDLREQGFSGLILAVPVVIAAVGFLSGGRWSFFFVLSYLARREHRRRMLPENQECPYVSVFVPCFNEGETIEAALNSLLELDYPGYEVIVVDDGSKDDTLEKARRFEGKFGGCTVRIFGKPNGGKWSAHNFAFRHSSGELILCVDADSRLEPSALRWLVSRMDDPEVSGVAGQMRVRNRESLLTYLQGLEYLMGNGSLRLGQGMFHTVLVVPGPIGLFRRSAMEEVWRNYSLSEDAPGKGRFAGPFEGDTFAEDFDLSLAILSLGGRIVYEPEAISHTKAPDRLFTLVNQRYRWNRGALQVLKKLFRRVRSGSALLSPRLLWWVLGTYVLELLILPAVFILGSAFFAFLLVQNIDLLPLFGWMGAFLLLQFHVGAFFTSVHKDTLKLLVVLPFYGVYNGFALSSAWAISVVDEIRGSRMRW